MRTVAIRLTDLNLVLKCRFFQASLSSTVLGHLCSETGNRRAGMRETLVSGFSGDNYIGLSLDCSKNAMLASN